MHCIMQPMIKKQAIGNTFIKMKLKIKFIFNSLHQTQLCVYSLYMREFCKSKIKLYV
ncbi:hypothetical protein XBP1_330054 [Xenorhabdus bovienii str. puntauvense]|uniref:Uncharacterized protein n=2 Tax=Xenorhabdus bovienii TaxID=40576 RepID=A0A0B6X1W0_XENBV|nr:hypothetical protein XBFFR1_2050094 [Xenorhabdus bovienii str. feltiae France]CDG92375.1 hypothetical protein XBFFL1_2170017 [Xenorhabdus bovienii str. feltiae Florida]CDG98546.1 hypothetical protein XBP1_330054 [Xenorhabdus bovienii str. puntauvense]CDM87470.1 protein of unknown function [Xenorhabdus bovienii]